MYVEVYGYVTLFLSVSVKTVSMCKDVSIDASVRLWLSEHV